MSVSVNKGAVTAVDTFCTQAFGAGKFREVGEWATVAITVHTLIFFVMALIWLIGPEFAFGTILRQDEVVTKAASLFVRITTPGMLPFIWQEVMRKWLQAQGYTTPSIVVAVLANGINLCLNFGLVHRLGFMGSPLATTLSRCCQLALLVGYCAFFKLHKKHNTFRFESFKQIRDVAFDWKRIRKYATVALPGGVASSVESLTFELSTPVVTMLHDHTLLDAHFVLLGFSALIFFSFPLGNATATCIRVGNEIGAGAAARAKHACKVGVSLGAMVGVLNLTTILTLRNKIGACCVLCRAWFN